MPHHELEPPFHKETRGHWHHHRNPCARCEPANGDEMGQPKNCLFRSLLRLQHITRSLDINLLKGTRHALRYDRDSPLKSSWGSSVSTAQYMYPNTPKDTDSPRLVGSAYPVITFFENMQK
jgi:hypothetical protein